LRIAWTMYLSPISEHLLIIVILRKYNRHIYHCLSKLCNWLHQDTMTLVVRPYDYYTSVNIEVGCAYRGFIEQKHLHKVPNTLTYGSRIEQIWEPLVNATYYLRDDNRSVIDRNVLYRIHVTHRSYSMLNCTFQTRRANYCDMFLFCF